MRQPISFRSSLSAVLLLSVSSAASAALISVDADAFFTGTDISTAFPGVTLSVVGTQVDSGLVPPQVYAIVGVAATTGVNSFASRGSAGWWEDLLMLRVDFDKPVRFFAIDVVGNSGGVGVVRAFNRDGIEVGSYTTEPLQSLDPLGQEPAFEVASIEPASEDIVYVLAYGLGGKAARLDNIRYEPTPRLRIVVSGGWQQECVELGGTTMQVEAIMVLEDLSITAVEWHLDELAIAYGNPASFYVPLGDHNLTATATLHSGEVLGASGLLSVRDTTPPSLSVWTTDRHNQSIADVSQKGLNTLTLNYSATDSCDPSPMVSALAGVPVENGQVLKLHTSVDQVVIDGPGFKVVAEATDESGNSVTQEIVSFPE